jgi:hypothetical protein
MTDTAHKIHTLHKILLHDVEVGVWCGLNKRAIIGLAFHAETIKPEE